MSLTKYRARFELNLEGKPADPGTVVRRAQDWITSVERRATPLPADGAEVTTHSGASLQRVDHHEDGEQLVTLRYARPDNVQGVRWITDLGVRSTSTCTSLDIGLSMGVVDPTRRPPQIRPPRLVGTILQDFDATCGVRVHANEQHFDSDGVDELIGLVGSPARTLPTVIASVDPFSEEPVLDTSEFLQRIRGLAHVVIISKRASLDLTTRLQEIVASDKRGRLWGVYNGAVRIFWPALDVRAETASPFDHRLWLPEDVRANSQRVMGELHSLVAWGATHRDIPAWLDVTTIHRTRDRRRLRELEKTLLGANAENAQYVELFAVAEAERQEAAEDRGEARQERDLAIERARNAERVQEELRFQMLEMDASLKELRQRAATLSKKAEVAKDLAVTQYAVGSGEGARGCLDKLLESYTDEAEDVRESLDWLASAENWLNPGNRLENLGKGLWEYRVNVKDHWFRLFCVRLTKARVVIVLHAYAKKQNKLDSGEVSVARKRMSDALDP